MVYLFLGEVMMMYDENAILEYFDGSYKLKVPISNLLIVGSEIGIRNLIEKDKIYFSGKNIVSLVDTNSGFSVYSYFRKITKHVDDIGKLRIDNLFGVTGSNKVGYKFVDMLRENDYIVDVMVKDLKASITIYSNTKYLPVASKAREISKNIYDMDINESVHEKLCDIGKCISKESKKPSFNVFYEDVDLYNKNGKTCDIIYDHLKDIGYNVSHSYRDKKFLGIKIGVQYGILISW